MDDATIPFGGSCRLPEQAQALKIGACAVGMAVAISDYPDFTYDLEEQEARARAASVLLRAANPNMTNDFPAFTSLFIEWDLIGYQWQCACSDAHPPAEAEKEKEAMLQLGNERTVQGLLPRAAQIVAERERP